SPCQYDVHFDRNLRNYLVCQNMAVDSESEGYVTFSSSSHVDTQSDEFEEIPENIVKVAEDDPEVEIHTNMDGLINIPQETEFVQIGEGGQAVVYSCYLKIEGIQQKYAVKSYSSDCSKSELTMLRKLEHVNIVKFIGLVQFNGRRSLLLEYCHSTLRSLLSSYPLEKNSVAAHAISIASGINYLHTNLILHRDLKPENVLIDSNRIAKLCDFGISREIHDKSTLFTFIGTRPYMAPELIRGENCSEKIDVWSFGIILWEMMTGKRPYEGIEAVVLVYAIGNKKAPLPIPFETHFESLSILLNRCWAENHHHRPSMDSVIASIENFKDELAETSETRWRRECVLWQSEVNDNWRTQVQEDAAKLIELIREEAVRDLEVAEQGTATNRIEERRQKRENCCYTCCISSNFCFARRVCCFSPLTASRTMAVFRIAYQVGHTIRWWTVNLTDVYYNYEYAHNPRYDIYGDFDNNLYSLITGVTRIMQAVETVVALVEILFCLLVFSACKQIRPSRMAPVIIFEILYVGVFVFLQIYVSVFLITPPPIWTGPLVDVISVICAIPTHIWCCQRLHNKKKEFTQREVSA
ncbi:hypothetical protein PFISCL1PPCAC_18682, partial [Pristionchus fissidentatus]